ncbi:ArsR family transcriptional regulator [Labedella phragmitis]|uniref:ArsR family transcriptional regulator n=1 Tax=Labedella phragmitis TaxID=2498849 RepID=A0A3S3ZAX9_9MICO|nr:metalloregulator ArsR/SmtB family transcription factor [Labedella phragmitis]RWZ52761.1 ArsR family transcriptional regulator [Labedella phragmitis]
MGADSNREDDLDRAFLALADPIRRRIVARLSRGPATVNELAEPFAITKQAVSRHIQVLETAGIVSRTRDAQRRPVHLEPARLEDLTAWIDRYRLASEQRFRSLDAILSTISSDATASTDPREQEER